MRTSTEQPSQMSMSSRPRPVGFKLGPLPPTPTFTSQAPTPSSAPTSGYSTSAFLTQQQEIQMLRAQQLHQATRGSINGHILNAAPVSPRLIPLGSPGPVTPLTLEEAAGGYLLAASHHHIHQNQLQLQTSHLEKLSATRKD